MPKQIYKEIVMVDIGTTEAANALADYFGAHLEAGHIVNAVNDLLNGAR